MPVSLPSGRRRPPVLAVRRVGPRPTSPAQRGGWAGKGRRLSSAHAVGELPEDVDVAVVPGCLLGQVEQDPAQGDRLSPPDQFALGRTVQVEGSYQVTVTRAGSLVLRQQLGERYLDC